MAARINPPLRPKVFGSNNAGSGPWTQGSVDWGLLGWFGVWVSSTKLEGNWGIAAWVKGLRFSADARSGGITKSSKPSPDHSKITATTKILHFEDFSLQPTLAHNRRNQRPGTVLYCTVVQ